MKPFVFQQFKIQQTDNVFKVGTDGVLLGALANILHAKTILEVGTGTGVIALMAAQRNPIARITALDIHHQAFELAENNFRASSFSERLQAVHQDYKEFTRNLPFDAVISNPPYFKENTSEKNVIARQRIYLDFTSLIDKTVQVLSESGIFSVIIPYEDGREFIDYAQQKKLHLTRIINIYGIKGGNVKRLILEFSKQPCQCQSEDFTIEKSPRQFSEQYLLATKDFHVFKQ